MPEWLIEGGIGEIRMALIEGDEIVEARVLLEGTLPAGTVARARLTRASVPAIAAIGASEYLLPKGAPGRTEGEDVAIEVVREAIPGPEAWKRPLARITEEQPRSAPLPEGELLPFPSPRDRLSAVGWMDLLDEARSGVVAFPGGELRVSPTPAMTLIDVDGSLPPGELALRGAGAAARTIRRHGVGGSIGIDLPTIPGKAERLAVAARFDASLPQPFERTAMNGFGFLQVIRPRRHPSLFELAGDRPAFEARALLRIAALDRPGAKRLVAHPAVVRVLEAHPQWIEGLAGQVGGAVTLRSNPALPISAGHVEQG